MGHYMEKQYNQQIIADMGDGVADNYCPGHNVWIRFDCGRMHYLATLFMSMAEEQIF